MKRKVRETPSAQPSEPVCCHHSSECGAIHDDCPNTFKGTCDREAGHSGSHSCNRCRSVF
jgi:hypothetical protein